MNAEVAAIAKLADIQSLCNESANADWWNETCCAKHLAEDILAIIKEER